VMMHEYDWRVSLEVLAAAFAARLRADPAPAVFVVGHSMGGLIARRALQDPALGRVRRLITLGTPHRGSFGAVQAIRGTYPVVRRLAALDRQHDAEQLAIRVFSTFPSIHQLLPAAGLARSTDFFDIANWPRSGPGPDLRLLEQARAFVGALPATEPRCIAISGTHQRTVTGLRLADDDFHYDISGAGDGTVPLECAQLAGSDNYFVRCEHSELPRSATIARAVLELLRHGRTRRIAATPGLRLGREVTVSDAVLRTTWGVKIDWPRLAAAARREYFNRLNQPPPQYAAQRTRRRQ
jgi:pimeloyl-ACP methyl ester carboxylesterase